MNGLSKPPENIITLNCDMITDADALYIINTAVVLECPEMLFIYTGQMELLIKL